MPTPSIEQCNSALDKGDADKALELAIALLRRDKHDTDALAACYKAYRQKNDSANAIKVLEILVGIQPRGDWPLAHLGQLHFEAGHIDRAEAALRRAIESNPQNARAHASIGVVFSELNRLSAGEWHFRRALELGGANCDVLTNLALNLTQQEKGSEADVLYAQAFQIDPRNVRTIAYWAKLKEALGDFGRSAELLDEADRLRPGSVDLLRATLHSRMGDHNLALRTIDKSPKLNGDALLERGRIKDLIGNYDAAWNDFVEAKRLLAEEGGLRYNAQAVEQFFADLKATFVTELWQDLPRSTQRTDTAQPIFIVGAPRSGTTLVERILAVHSAIDAGGELPFVAELRELSEKLLPDLPFPQNLRALRVADRRHLVHLFRDHYLARREERLGSAGDVRYVTDKMPFNEMYLPLIRMAFPDCPIVHLSRHRLDVTVSMMSNKMNHGFYCAYRIEDIAHHLHEIDKLTQHYRMQFDPRALQLDYETLVAEPEATVRKLLDYIGLPFEAQCLAFHRERRFVATPSYRQVDEPISNRSVGRHRNYRQYLGNL